MFNRITIKNPLIEKKALQKRIAAISIFIVICVVILIVRLLYLQIDQHRFYSTLSQKNQLILSPIEPNRGLIYDRNGVLLAENIPVFSLDIIPDHVPNLNETIARLKKIIKISDDDLQQFTKTLEQSRPFETVPLKLKLSKTEVAQFSVSQFQFPGVLIQSRMLRHYPLGKITAPVLGYVGRISSQELNALDPANYSGSNFVGKVGIEKFYEQALHGIVGYQQVEVDASGRAIRTLQRIDPIPGDDLYLTIDSDLQLIATQALNKERGAVVAIKPDTGEILALVSNPSYDPNTFAVGISQKQLQKLQASNNKPLYNRAISGQYPMASTIKPFIALEALNSDIISEDYTIYDPGWFRLPNTEHIYRDWKREGHGYVNTIQAIIVSSDRFFYNLAVMLGIDKVGSILNQFGFGRKTGIDLPGELAGLVPTPTWKLRTLGTPWYAGDTVISGIGQGFMLTTPLQLANATAILATRGLQFRPHLLLNTQPANRGMIFYRPKGAGTITLQNKHAWQVITTAMQGVVKSVDPNGTARLRFGTDIQYTVAAKTGTGQVYSRHDRDEEEHSQNNVPKQLRNHSLFIAFAPVNNPKIALAVIAEHSAIAGTVARKVLDYYLVTKKHKT